MDDAKQLFSYSSSDEDGQRAGNSMSPKRPQVVLSAEITKPTVVQPVNLLDFVEDGAFGSSSAIPPPVNAPRPTRLPSLDGTFLPRLSFGLGLIWNLLQRFQLTTLNVVGRPHSPTNLIPALTVDRRTTWIGLAILIARDFTRLTSYNRGCPNRGGPQNGKRDDGMTPRRDRENGDIRIPDGWTADGEAGSISAQKKGTDGEEKSQEDNIAAAGNLPSGPQQGTDTLVDKTQLFEVTNRNNEHGQDVVQGAGDPASTSSKRKRMSVLAWDANRSSRPSVSRGSARTRDDNLTPTVCLTSDSCILVGNEPGWKRLASRTFLPHEVISLIEATLMSQDEVKTIGNLCGDDAQNFIDVIHEVPSPLLHFRCTVLLPLPVSVSLFSDLRLPLIRLWTSQIANPSSGGGVYVFYAGYAAAGLCSRSRCKSHSATIDRVPRYIAAGMPTCGRANTKVAMSQLRS